MKLISTLRVRSNLTLNRESRVYLYSLNLKGETMSGMYPSVLEELVDDTFDWIFDKEEREANLGRKITEEEQIEGIIQDIVNS